jgi:hypothetical protein
LIFTGAIALAWLASTHWAVMLVKNILSDGGGPYFSSEVVSNADTITEGLSIGFMCLGVVGAFIVPAWISSKFSRRTQWLHRH